MNISEPSFSIPWNAVKAGWSCIARGQVENQMLVGRFIKVDRKYQSISVEGNEYVSKTSGVGPGVIEVLMPPSSDHYEVHWIRPNSGNSPVPGGAVIGYPYAPPEVPHYVIKVMFLSYATGYYIHGNECGAWVIRHGVAICTWDLYFLAFHRSK